ncbi:hypothetical protein [Halomarina rubra]|uniref:Halobacterial output domain-containing protein n=1 Tax=Halomarina rubra TaxID=2071873 RepID=A0ABD6AU82_9EURY|nr:hypothetical protein [Halomarina rubra]
MSRQGSAVTSEEQFKDQLDELVASARSNGVDVEGAWSCRLDVDRYDFEVLVSAVDAV